MTSPPDAWPGPEKGPKTLGHQDPLLPGPPGYSPTASQPGVSVILQERPRNVCRRRFWHFLACAFLAFCAVYLFLQRGERPFYPFYRSKQVASAINYLPDQCAENVNWEKVSDVPFGYRFHSRTSVTLPLSADVLSVITQGARSQGSLEISQTADAGSDVVVDVDVFYRNQDEFDEMTVCRVHPADNEWGLGIFTPQGWSPHGRWNPIHPLRFNVHLRLPAASSLTVKELKTDLHNFSQHLRALADSVHFNKVGLKSTNSRIEADSVAGDDLRFHTTNAAIHGSFKTTSELELQSSNGRIESHITLLPATSDGTGGSYHVTTQTSNSQINLEFVDAPLDHTLTLSAHTSNARAEVTMHETFEGSFDLSTSNAPATAVDSRDMQDPAGRGRKRGVEAHAEKRNHVSGNVWWDAENKDKGRVSVRTSNAQVHLTL